MKAAGMFGIDRLDITAETPEILASIPTGEFRKRQGTDPCHRMAPVDFGAGLTLDVGNGLRYC